MPEQDSSTYLMLNTAAARLSLHPITLRRAISIGELRGYKFGKALRVRVDDLDRWAESKTIPNARTTAPPGRRTAASRAAETATSNVLRLGDSR